MRWPASTPCRPGSLAGPVMPTNGPAGWPPSGRGEASSMTSDPPPPRARAPEGRVARPAGRPRRGRRIAPGSRRGHACLRAAFQQVDELRASEAAAQAPRPRPGRACASGHAAKGFSMRAPRAARCPRARVRTRCRARARPSRVLPWSALAGACVVALGVGLSRRAREEPPAEALRGGLGARRCALPIRRSRARRWPMRLRAAGGNVATYETAASAGLSTSTGPRPPTLACVRALAALAARRFRPAGWTQVRIEIAAAPWTKVGLSGSSWRGIARASPR